MGGSGLPVPKLADGVVRLRAWAESDVPALLAAFRDPWFDRFNDWAPNSVDAALSYLAQIERRRRDGHQIELAIVDPSPSGPVLGGASLHDVDRMLGRGTVGYWLAPGARGRGLASRAVRLLGGWALRDLALARLELTCGPDNHASQAVAQRCGFSREGLLRSHVAFKGGRRDSVLFSCLPGELT